MAFASSRRPLVFFFSPPPRPTGRVREFTNDRIRIDFFVPSFLPSAVVRDAPSAALRYTLHERLQYIEERWGGRRGKKTTTIGCRGNARYRAAAAV